MINNNPYFKLLTMDVSDLISGYCRIEINLKIDDLTTTKEGKTIIEGRQIKIGHNIYLSGASIYGQ